MIFSKFESGRLVDLKVEESHSSLQTWRIECDGLIALFEFGIMVSADTAKSLYERLYIKIDERRMLDGHKQTGGIARRRKIWKDHQ